MLIAESKSFNLGHKNLKSLDIYNPHLDMETKEEMASALLVPKAGQKRKALKSLESLESSGLEDESNTEDEFVKPEDLIMLIQIQTTFQSLQSLPIQALSPQTSILCKVAAIIQNLNLIS